MPKPKKPVFYLQNIPGNVLILTLTLPGPYAGMGGSLTVTVA